MNNNNEKQSNFANSISAIVNKYMIAIFFATIIFVLFAIFYVGFSFDEIEPSENMIQVNEELMDVDQFLTKTYDELEQDGLLKDLEIIDDTISPEEINQAVSIEIKRVHKRNIEELMRKPGIFWRNKPLFYVKLLFDEVSWDSVDVSDWDTGIAAWQVNRFVDDETETVDFSIQIIEKTPRMFMEKESVIEEIDITYDFRTGVWTGDDYFNDSDGYGHFVGADYEIWFGIYQTEQDGDNIPYWTEINILKTDPTVDDSKLDPDNDKIPTAWESKWGYDPFVFDNHTALDPDLDGLENTEEYTLSKWLADPFYQEIYLEVDFMQKGPGLFAMEHIFWKESQWMLMDIFTPHHISVHIDDGWPTGSSIGGGEFLPYVEEYLGPLSGVLSGFYKYHFADCRKGSFRYVVIHHSGGWNYAQTNELHADVISIPSNREFYRNVYFPPAATPRLKRLAMAVAVVHELGHSLALNPEYCAGIDNASQVGRNNLAPLQKMQAKINARQYWDTYHSVMNYHKFGLYVLDYSDGTHGKHDSNDWEQIDLTFFQKPFDYTYGVGDS